MRNIIILFFVCTTVIGCFKKPFDRASYVFLYLEKIQGIEEIQDAEIIVLQDAICGACDIEIYSGTKDYLTHTDSEVYVIQMKRNPEVEKELQARTNIKFLDSSPKELSKYGLSGARNYLFIVKNNEIVDWFGFDVKTGLPSIMKKSLGVI